MVVMQFISIFIEALIAFLGLLIVFRKKKAYGWGIFLTFCIYVFYDAFKLLEWPISSLALSIMFFIATVSALVSVWIIYKEKKK
jgi:hypothetical protein